MNFGLLALALVALVPSNAQESCPVVFLKDGCSGQEHSVCWSPGEPDVDCPNNGICCFNGCSNQCGVPDRAVVPKELQPQECQVVLVDRQETVQKEMCTDEPECRKVPSEECTKEPKEICTDKPCLPQEKLEEFKTTECKNSSEECFKVPEKQCNNITEQVCNGTVEQCTQTELTGADCGCQTVCSWEKQVKCPAPKKSKGYGKRSVVLSRTKRTFGSRRIYGGRRYSGYSRPSYIESRRYYKSKPVTYRRPSYTRPRMPVTYSRPIHTKPKCEKVKVKTCKEVPYPDTHKCTKDQCEEVPACRDVTRPVCSMVEREECTPPRQICTEVTRNRVVNSTDHCPEVPAQACTQVENEVCKVVTRNQCEPKRRCRQVPMTVTYQVPQKVCQ